MEATTQLPQGREAISMWSHSCQPTWLRACDAPWLRGHSSFFSPGSQAQGRIQQQGQHSLCQGCPDVSSRALPQSPARPTAPLNDPHIPTPEAPAAPSLWGWISWSPKSPPTLSILGFCDPTFPLQWLPLLLQACPWVLPTFLCIPQPPCWILSLESYEDF